MTQIQKITIKGYKSIKTLIDFELRPLNVLIGANGSGKSNFISVFRFLAAVAGDNFAVDVQRWGGPEALLHYGKKITPQIEMEMYFTPNLGVTNGYRITLESTLDNRLIFTREEPFIHGHYSPKGYPLGTGHATPKITSDTRIESAKVSKHVTEKLKIWRQYHFHDTSDTAAVKGRRGVNENLRLLPDAANLAAYLRMLKCTAAYTASYQRIVDTIRLAAPFFGDFVFREEDTEYIELEWTERGQPDTPWKAHVLSDGTLRFICLTTLLLQPESLLPDTLLIDEPELGLHPFAINLLADMLQQVAETRQVIVSTQSVELLNAFTPEDVVVVQRENNETTFKRLNAIELQDWLADYSLGELWQRNILGGRPSR